MGRKTFAYIIGYWAQMKLRLNMSIRVQAKQGQRYPERLNELLEDVNTKASIDYNNPEIQDIKQAVCRMLKRIKDRVNERGVFEISRIEPCGSMAEKTAAWKYSRQTRERNTEFDFLAVLAHSPDIVRRNHGCTQCVRVTELPLQKNTLYDKKYSGLWIDDNDRRRCNKIFLRELNTCLGSACDCFSVLFDNRPKKHSYVYKLAEKCESDYKCDTCVVEMDTGVLRVNNSVSVGPTGGANCSLAFRWTSKAKSLSAFDELLQEETREIKSLSIHVDFLPALEVHKAEPDENSCDHDFFLVPKHCNKYCDHKKKNEPWRKSNCMAEIAHILNEMSEKHRKCYKIVKYLLSRQLEYTIVDINGYTLKTAVLRHSQDSRKCSDSSEACAECVLKILTDLKHNFKQILSFHYQFYTPTKGLTPHGGTFSFDPFFQKLIDRLCSVAHSDSCSILLQPISDFRI